MKMKMQSFVNGFLVKEIVVESEAEYDRYLRDVTSKYGDEVRTECLDLLKERYCANV